MEEVAEKIFGSNESQEIKQSIVSRMKHYEVCMDPNHHKSTKEEIKQLLDQKNIITALDKLTPLPCCKETMGLTTLRNENVYDGVFRSNWINHYCCWHLPPTLPQLHELVQFIGNTNDNNIVLEVGAGKGILAALLQSCDVNVVATDVMGEDKFYGAGHFIKPEHEDIGVGFSYVPIEKLTVSQALEKYGAKSKVLMSCWGNYNIREDDLQHFTGNKAIIIGEQNGCTGCGHLQNICEEGKEGWQHVKTIKIPIFNSLHDECYLYERIK